MTHCRFLIPHERAITLIPRVVGRRRSLPSEICVQSDPPPFEKCRLRPISAHNVSTVGDSEKSSITTNIKSPRAFQRAIDGVRTLPLSAQKGGSKSDFFAFEHKSTAEALSTYFVGQCYQHWWSAAILFAHRRRRRRDLYSAARPSRRNGLFTIWCVSVNCVMSQWCEK